MEKQVSERSTKKELWDAYQELTQAKTVNESIVGATEASSDPDGAADSVAVDSSFKIYTMFVYECENDQHFFSA